MRRRGHLFYLQSLCFQGTLINHFLCIELPNQKTIIYFTKKKKSIFYGCQIGYIPSLYRLPSICKVYTKTYRSVSQSNNNFDSFESPHPEVWSCWFDHWAKVSSFIHTERSSLGISQRTSKQRWTILTSNCTNSINSWVVMNGRRKAERTNKPWSDRSGVWQSKARAPFEGRCAYTNIKLGESGKEKQRKGREKRRKVQARRARVKALWQERLLSE